MGSQKKKNGDAGLVAVDFDVYISIDRFVTRWPENVREMINRLNDFGQYYSFHLVPEKFHLYRLLVGGCYGDPEGRAVIPFQRPRCLTSDDV